LVETGVETGEKGRCVKEDQGKPVGKPAEEAGGETGQPFTGFTDPFYPKEHMTIRRNIAELFAVADGEMKKAPAPVRFP